MLTASSLLIGLMIAAVLGGASTAWLWLVQRRQAESAAGLKLLSAMRWREFSRLVTEALRGRGFEEEAVEDAAERGQQSDLRLQREGHTWMLACKQGSSHKITPAAVAEMLDTVRFHGATGGLIATTGTIEPAARKAAGGNIELIDGATLWPLVEPQLAHSVRDELQQQSRSAALRGSVLACVAALALGLGVAWALPETDSARAGGGLGTTGNRQQQRCSAASSSVQARDQDTCASLRACGGIGASPGQRGRATQ